MALALALAPALPPAPAPAPASAFPGPLCADADADAVRTRFICNTERKKRTTRAEKHAHAHAHTHEVKGDTTALSCDAPCAPQGTTEGRATSSFETRRANLPHTHGRGGLSAAAGAGRRQRRCCRRRRLPGTVWMGCGAPHCTLHHSVDQGLPWPSMPLCDLSRAPGPGGGGAAPRQCGVRTRRHGTVRRGAMNV